MKIVKGFWMYIKPSLYAGYLAGAMSVFCDISVLDWQFYVVIVPTIVFVVVFRE